jgi:hypothetical protein
MGQWNAAAGIELNIKTSDSLHEGSEFLLVWIVEPLL